ncbi:MAG: ammonium transporter [Spirochaetia bacterium]|nr:ammonium transporter [Spirochaetia bacterium]
MKRRTYLLILYGFLAQMPLFAEEASAPVQQVAESASKASVDALLSDTNALWLCVAAFLVFFMQAGFAYVEAGFTRSKNTVNILMKNVTDFLFGTVVFWLVGFAIMFGPHIIDSFGIGKPGLATSMLEIDGKPSGHKMSFFIFQLVFCATAATIVSGAMAERTKFISYILYSIIVSALIYPVFGSLAWSNLWNPENAGFLVKLGFIDFAGSTVVHSIGGWIGLAGAIVLGPRIGKFKENGATNPILGHNMSMSTLGVFILWLGWFGFNPGSTGVITGATFATVAVVTNMAAAMGGITAMMVSWILFRRPDVSMVLNGILAGLVAITAPCYNVGVGSAALIGGIAGILVVLFVVLMDLIHIDDPVGAVPVHGFCGLWGTLSVGLFADPNYGGGPAGLFFGGGFKQLGIQAIGAGMAFVWAFGCGLLMFTLMKYTIGLRVTVDEELEGLDILEHGNSAYPEQS